MTRYALIDLWTNRNVKYIAISINRARLTTLDNLTAYVCTIADRYMLAEHLAVRMNSPLESDEGVPVADMMHWCHPSAEMVAESREVEL